MNDFLTHILPWLIATNLALSAISKILEELHVKSPAWLQAVITPLQTLIDWVSPRSKQLPPQ